MEVMEVMAGFEAIKRRSASRPEQEADVPNRSGKSSRRPSRSPYFKRTGSDLKLELGVEPGMSSVISLVVDTGVKAALATSGTSISSTSMSFTSSVTGILSSTNVPSSSSSAFSSPNPTSDSTTLTSSSSSSSSSLGLSSTTSSITTLPVSSTSASATFPDPSSSNPALFTTTTFSSSFSSDPASYNLLTIPSKSSYDYGLLPILFESSCFVDVRLTVIFFKSSHSICDHKFLSSSFSSRSPSMSTLSPFRRSSTTLSSSRSSIISSSSRPIITLSTSSSSSASAYTLTPSPSHTASLEHTSLPAPPSSSHLRSSASPKPSSLVPTPASKDSFASNKGAIIGVTIGSTMALFAFSFAVFFFCARVRRNRTRAMLEKVGDGGGSGGEVARVDSSGARGAGTVGSGQSKSMMGFLSRGISGSSGSARPMLYRNPSTSTAHVWRSPLSDEYDDDNQVYPLSPSHPGLVSPGSMSGMGMGMDIGLGLGTGIGAGVGLGLGLVRQAAEVRADMVLRADMIMLTEVEHIFLVLGPQIVRMAVETMRVGSSPSLPLQPLPPQPQPQLPIPAASAAAVLPRNPSSGSGSSPQDYFSSATIHQEPGEHIQQLYLYRTATVASSIAQANTSATGHGGGSSSYSHSYSGGHTIVTGSSNTALSAGGGSGGPPSAWTKAPSLSISIPKVQLNDESLPSSRSPTPTLVMRTRKGLIARLRGGRSSASFSSSFPSSISSFDTGETAEKRFLSSSSVKSKSKSKLTSKSRSSKSSNRRETPPSASYYPVIPERTSLLNPPLPHSSSTAGGIMGGSQLEQMQMSSRTPSPSPTPTVDSGGEYYANDGLLNPAHVRAAAGGAREDPGGVELGGGEGGRGIHGVGLSHGFRVALGGGVETGNVEGDLGNQSAYSLSDDIDYSRPFRGFVFNRVDSTTTVTSYDTRTTQTHAARTSALGTGSPAPADVSDPLEHEQTCTDTQAGAGAGAA
ncbi:hypothetical protein D9757_009005 [Collybiopsis confluens]|uniref:Uncharacterized protein n=1 Tax=Collybiopsis confluens TaxID=2823264 RepID=A0A8H5H2U8_9AGAR|nr:hypothetical protein D9757_009005 [Collybiopsis confluens]